MKKYTNLAISNPDDLRFGIAPHPVRTRMGMEIGGGQVYPEINFTLPSLQISEATWSEIHKQYHEMITGVLHRAAELEAPGVVVEFETLPPMTEHPHMGLDIVKVLLEEMEKARDQHSLKSVLRMTPNDNREFDRPPKMRDGYYFDRMLRLFEDSAAAGAELLSIESVGGKELHDEALVGCDISQVIFSLCVLGARDMEFLWSRLHQIAVKHGAFCAGDTACGFGNTAMVLSEQKMIPRVFAAVVRAVTAVRSLVAYQCGAVGPGKDCGYENPILKAITGCPMAMEGKSSACAHFSPMGNIAAATCDTWSNESVQNVKLLGGMAPTVSMEQLVYDCRLMNQALSEGRDSSLALRRWMIQSDASLDPQAYILSPQSAVSLAETIVSQPCPYLAGKAVALRAVSLLRDGLKEGRLKILSREQPWLDTIEDAVSSLPEDEDVFIEELMSSVDSTHYSPAEYQLPAA